MVREGSRRGSIDPFFPAKIAVSHVHNLLTKKQPDVIFFPEMMNVPSDIHECQAGWSCPTVQGIPEVVKAAFTTEKDAFAERTLLLRPRPPHGRAQPLRAADVELLPSILGVSAEENARPLAEGYRALEAFRDDLRRRAREVLDRLEREGRLGVVLLGRPYHNDPAVHHDIPELIQRLGYPVFTIDSLPMDDDILDRFFGEEVRRGEIADRDIHDVWKHTFSENTSRKVWAAKFVARHPNLTGIDFSSFKCGLDAPIYHVIEGILEAAGTPYFAFHDLDENRPAGSIKLRVETIDYFLRRRQEEMSRRREAARDRAAGGELRKRLEEEMLSGGDVHDRSRLRSRRRSGLPPCPSREMGGRRRYVISSGPEPTKPINRRDDHRLSPSRHSPGGAPGVLRAG
jgi:predicted nucleotide-binding protein (sugar kinase/HSP70/actin superfamily)